MPRILRQSNVEGRGRTEVRDYWGSVASRHFPEVTARIANFEQIVAFRNRLIHGYSVVSDALVWDVIENDLPKLKSDAEALLNECERNQSPQL